MKVLYLASEARPFIASGGLADVAGALPKSLAAQGAECSVIIPMYSGIDTSLRGNLTFVTSFNVPLSWRNLHCGVFTTTLDSVTYYFIDNEFYFSRNGIYGFFDDAERFAFFSKACLEVIHNLGLEVDILHANDWQTALSIVYLNVYFRDLPQYKDIKTVFTIHNIAYQGKFGLDVIGDVCGLPWDCHSLIEFDGAANFMKGAIDCADRVTTVSPTYALELTDPWYAYGLDGFLRDKSYKLSGILNGIDDELDPKTDKHISSNFDLDSIEKKQANKQELLEIFGLPVSDAPVLAIVSRLVAMKGMELVRHVFDEIVAMGYRIIVLGAGDNEFEMFFTHMQYKYPEQVSVRLGFFSELARKIYAGADIFLMPSKSEPCGLAQMVASMYGAIPVVRETGGLKDTIIDFSHPHGNGYTFLTFNAHDMLHALYRARVDYDDKPSFREKIRKSMICDFSWNTSAGEYINLYKGI